MERTEPPYAKIAAELRRRITDGELRPGDRVPSTRQITRQWGVAMATATKVIATLTREGLVRPVPGVGTVVEASPATAQTPTPSATQASALTTAQAPTPATQASARTTAQTTALADHPAIQRERHDRMTGDHRRGAAHELTRERIVRTAIDIADAEGLSALSMRRVAGELGVATMSLYRYVPGKDELITLMADEVFGEPELPEVPPPGWSAQLEVAARAQWALYRRHPWLASVLSIIRPQPLPHGMVYGEWIMRAMDGFGFDLSTLMHINVLIVAYVRGIATELEAEVEAERDTGIDFEQWLDERQEAFTSAIIAGGFEMYRRLDEADDVPFDLDTLFEFGLERLLDGIGILIERQANGRDPGLTGA